jgi:hypothetical protein
MMKIFRELFFKILFGPEQVVMLKRFIKRPQLRSRDRLFVVGFPFPAQTATGFDHCQTRTYQNK